MKHSVKFVALALLVCMLFVFTGCTTYSQLQNAYDVAVKNGFTGNEEEWLNSLKGESAYEIWLAAGNSGTKEDFLASLTNNINNYNININASDATAMATGKALLSVVSVYSKFTKKVYVREGFNYRETEYEYSSAGSGVIYRLNKEAGDAYIITNYHVIFDADNIATENGTSKNVKVYLYGMEYESYAIEASVVGGSPNYDIAVLKVENSDILRKSSAMQVETSDGDALVVGQTAIAIGNPEALGISATSGIVCVDSENISMTALSGNGTVSMRVIRIDTAINSGNSGGGLFNSEGKLIGITNAKIVSSDTENIAYAIPSSIAVSVANNVIDYCADGTESYMQRCLVGITVSTTNSHALYDEETGKVSIEETVVVSEVGESGLAKGKIEKDDVISAITIGEQTYPITRTFMLIDTMLNSRVGDTVTFHLLRDGTNITVDLTINESCVVDY